MISTPRLSTVGRGFLVSGVAGTGVLIRGVSSY